VTCDSFGAALRQKVGAGAQVTRGGLEPQGHVPAPVLSPAAGARGGPGAAPSREWEPEPRGHMAASELSLAGGRSHCLDLKLVRGGTRSSGYRQWPPGPPRERLRIREWGQHHFPS
jgi:hypothetical protein